MSSPVLAGAAHARAGYRGEMISRAAAVSIGLVVALGGCSHPSATPDAPPAGADVWVDPALGTDDLQHGGGPGALAYRTITFALAHATGTIQLDAGDYTAASGETFPLVLGGDQALTGDPQRGAHIAGNGALAGATTYAAIVLAGRANRVDGVDVTTTAANLDRFPVCVAITTSGAHVVGGSDLHDCPIVIDLGGHGGVTVRDVTSGGSRVENCLNQVGDDVRVERLACSAVNDWVFGCGARFTGCGTIVMGRVAACSEDLGHFADPCP